MNLHARALVLVGLAWAMVMGGDVLLILVALSTVVVVGGLGNHMESWDPGPGSIRRSRAGAGG